MEVKLNLGAGREKREGFKSVDMNPNVGADIVGPADNLWMLGMETIEEIRAVDVLEHLPYRKTDAALTEWARVLQPGGKLFVQVPDADMIMSWYVRNQGKLLERLPDDLPRTPMAGAAWRLLGGQEDGVITQEGDAWQFNAHYAMFSEETLVEALERAGFVVDSVERNVHPNLLVWSHKA